LRKEDMIEVKITKEGLLIKPLREVPERLFKYGIVRSDTLFIDRLNALYIIDKGILDKYIESSHNVKFEDLISYYRRYDKNIFSKYLIFRDLTDRGYKVVEGYSDDIDLLVYDKGDYPDKPARIRIIGIEEGVDIPVRKILNELNLSIINKKQLVIAVIERRGEVVYYKVDRFIGGKICDKSSNKADEIA